MKRYLTGLLAAALLLTGCGAARPAFSDASAESLWVDDAEYACISTAMLADDKRAFSPDEQLTLGEAARMIMVIYDTTRGIPLPTEEEAPDWLAQASGLGLLPATDPARPVTRAELLAGLVRALPDYALDEFAVVENGSVPDVPMDDPRAPGIYRLLRAGILLPAGEGNAVCPNDPLTRAEAAGLTARALDPSRRIPQQLLAPDTWPDLSRQPRADEAFFKDAAILGNSLVDGLRLYSSMREIDYHAGTGISVISATMKRTVTLTDGTQVTQLDAMLRQPYNKIYIELGINEIGLETAYFIELYTGIIDRIQAERPDATIYIMALLPVTAQKSAEGTFTMSRINAYNQALYELAAAKNCYYLDVCTPLQGEDGFLPPELASDGVHLVPDGYKIWEETIRTYYAW